MKFILKNKKLVHGIIAIFVIVVAVFIWNNYQIEISERPVKPIRPPAIISRECGIEQCHGLDISCGPNIPKQCTGMYSFGDGCRRFAHCETISRKCQLVKDPQFEKCKSCVEKCEADFKDDVAKASQCESDCAK